MILRTIDPVVAYCIQICIHVQFYWGGIVTACIYCGVLEQKGLLCVYRSWRVLELRFWHVRETSVVVVSHVIGDIVIVLYAVLNDVLFI